MAQQAADEAAVIVTGKSKDAYAGLVKEWHSYADRLQATEDRAKAKKANLKKILHEAYTAILHQSPSHAPEGDGDAPRYQFLLPAWAWPFDRQRPGGRREGTSRRLSVAEMRHMLPKSSSSTALQYSLIDWKVAIDDDPQNPWSYFYKYVRYDGKKEDRLMEFRGSREATIVGEILISVLETKYISIKEANEILGEP